MSRCTGHCCERFVIMGLTHEDFKSFYVAHITGEDEFVDSNGKSWNPQVHKTREITQIYEMLIPLGLLDINPDNENSKQAFYFTCKNFDKEKRICTVYDTRPDMCRNYPVKDNDYCEYKNCTYSKPCIRTGCEVIMEQSELREIKVLNKQLNKL